MKILHTSDWHLGKKLDGFSRIEEQYKFIDELEEIVNKESVDVILVAGDVYDTVTPPLEAEELYYKALKRLSAGGKRAVVVIAGNHDSPKKILAFEPLASEHGIISFGYPNEIKEVGIYGDFCVKEAYEGGILLSRGDKEIYINALPYPSQKTMNELWGEDFNYSKRIGEVLKKSNDAYLGRSPRVIISHLFTLGSINEGTERQIELGGSQIFDLKEAPEVDYFALGHIHKPIIIKDGQVAYSGSPLEFRVSEGKFQKKVFIKNLVSGEFKVINLTNHKPIKCYSFSSVDEALGKLKEVNNEWIYLELNLKEPLASRDIRKLKENKNLIEIQANIKSESSEEEIDCTSNDKSIEVSFEEFYLKEYGIKPRPEIFKKFMSLIETVEVE